MSDFDTANGQSYYRDRDGQPVMTDPTGCYVWNEGWSPYSIDLMHDASPITADEAEELAKEWDKR